VTQADQTLQEFPAKFEAEMNAARDFYGAHFDDPGAIGAQARQWEIKEAVDRWLYREMRRRDPEGPKIIFDALAGLLLTIAQAGGHNTCEPEKSTMGARILLMRALAGVDTAMGVEGPKSQPIAIERAQ